MRKSAPILLLIILFVTVTWFFLTKKPDEAHELSIAHTLPATPVTEQPAPPQPPPPTQDFKEYIEPEPVIVQDPLPPLDQSDSRFTQSLTEITGADPLAEFLVKSQAISRFVGTLDSLTSRQVPPQINPVKPVDDKFITDTEGESPAMSARNYSRYDGHVKLLQNADTDALLTLYQRYYPLFQQAWEENGGEGSFNQRLKEVIDNLLETPDVPGPVYLTKPEAVYLFEDPVLEGMTAGQKILVRMGTVNASIVKEKLIEVKVGLNSY